MQVDPRENCQWWPVIEIEHRGETELWNSPDRVDPAFKKSIVDGRLIVSAERTSAVLVGPNGLSVDYTTELIFYSGCITN